MSQPDAPDLAATTLLVARFAPNRPDPATLTGDLDLVGDLGYDSVRLVELLLAVADAFALPLPLEAILAGPALSIGALASEVTRARARS